MTNRKEGGHLGQHYRTGDTLIIGVPCVDREELGVIEEIANEHRMKIGGKWYVKGGPKGWKQEKV